MQFLKQSTAVDVVLGPFVDDSDGKTTKEALTLAQADLQLTKNGGAAAQKNEATSASHLYGGNYKVPLNTTDTGTLGCLTLMCKESGALPVIATFMVVTANWYDTMCGSDKLDVNVEEWNATSVPTEDTAGYPKVTVKAGTGTGEVSLSSGAVTVGTNNDKTGYTASTVSDKTGYALADATSDAVIADAVWNALTASYGSANTYGALVETNLDAAISTRLAPAGTLATVTNLTNAPTAGDLTATMKASINAEVDTALADIHLDHLLATDYDPASKPGAATALLNELIGNDAGVSQFTANALELGPSGSLTAAAIADAVWDEVLDTAHEVGGSSSVLLQAAGTAADPWLTTLPGSYGSGTAGKIIGDNLNATVGSRATQTSVDTIDTNVDSILDDTGTAGVVVASGSKTGYALADASSDAVIADAVWNAATSGYGAAGSYGLVVETNLDTTVSSRLAPAGTLATVTNLTNAPTSGDLTATMKASVNAEVLDVLTVDTFAEVSGVPAATSTIKDKLNWLFALGRNKKTQTATTATLRNDADGGNIATAGVSDDTTTFTHNEWA